ncbi:myosin class 2 heavy chain [Sporothrix schenckii 1099-18]|uniref:Myosin class 2 heavy chain n=1 Tax=Sporothrix schenckii 1099-18 TaxID=1397361 RepID=A0A0F2M1M8_SPOSC|nr:myosin class 2 heavy chain [Sporothrix schenckii 1099-18]KJR82675.1 myosin class 2 heavy chain [Sporothrix schenckii 1099-18]
MRLSHTSSRSLTTSSPLPTQQTLLGAAAQEADRRHRPRTPSNPGSPAWSTASTADAGPSPILPALVAPRLPERAQALLGTPPPADAATGQHGEDSRFVTASWGSPYPQSDTSRHLRFSSLSSDPSDDSPIHHLEIQTPFLRPAPYQVEESEEDEDARSAGEDLLSSPPFSAQQSSSLVSATVLANRARRPARGLTEDWIRQHTTGDFGSEARLWLSDNSSAGDSENSSLSGSVSGDHDEVDELSLRTPRAIPVNRAGRSPSSLVSAKQQPRRNRAHHPRHPSSLETLRESDLNRLHRAVLERGIHESNSKNGNMATADSPAGPDMPTDPAADQVPPPAVATENTATAVSTAAAPATPPSTKASIVPGPEAVPLPPPATPPSKTSASGTQPDLSLDPLGELAVSKMAASPRKTPRRVKKKLPWKGKSIIVLLPLDEQRGKIGKAPKPLTKTDVDNMLHSWEELGYDVKGFDLNHSVSANDHDYYGEGSRSMSRPSWPDEGDIVRERAQRKYPIRLPDLNAWKNYVEELNEAKLRALGVSFGDEEPPLPPAISPGAGASISRQSSATVYPPLPFSPPIPTSSASSNHGVPPFTFPGAFVPGASGTQSPSILSTASPIPFGANPNKYNRQSISIPAGMFQLPPLQQQSPGGFSPQTLLMQHGIVRGGSPSLAALSSVMSPTSPFTPDGSFTSPPLHQRHQSLQYPMMQYPQLQTSARASPRLQDLREIEEEVEEQPINKSPSKTPEPTNSRPFIQHNASLSLQNEIDAAEYHLEEQFRSQFEHDRDYSPHGGKDPSEGFGVDADSNPTDPQHSRGLSVQFAPPPPIQRFRDETEGGPPLHHPRPHSRGHSLANAYYEPDETRNSGSGTSFTEGAISATSQSNAQNNGSQIDDSYDVETNPSNLGTPVQGLDFGNVLQPQKDQKQIHQRAFSTASNPWSEGASFSGKASSTRRPSHGSKASLSNLNVEAPEFKFNPGAASTFQPAATNQFMFGSGSNPTSEPFQPSIFQAGLAPNAPLSGNSSTFSFPTTTTTTSKINANAPTFSPGQSEFSFSAAGPKFRPDAPAFTPLHSFSDSLTSPIQSGGESSVNGANRTSSIFGNIDLNLPDIVKPVKRSKAVPIVRPSSRQSPKANDNYEEKENATEYDREGRIIDDSRVKRARATPMNDDNDEIHFAEPGNNALTVASATPEPSREVIMDEIAPNSQVEKPVEILPSKETTTAKSDEKHSVGSDDVAAEVETTGVAEIRTESETPQAESVEKPLESDDAEAEKANQDEGENAVAEDSTLSSTVLSESTDAVKQPATTSPSELSPVSSIPWMPFEFRSDVDVADFNSARPMGDDVFRHKKSLSATAKPFSPGASFQGTVANNFQDDLLAAEKILPTTEVTQDEQPAAFEPSPVSPSEVTRFSSPPPPPPPVEDKPKPKGLAASRYAMSPPRPPPKTLQSSRFTTSSPPPVPSPSKDTKPVEDTNRPEQQSITSGPEASLQTEPVVDESPVAAIDSAEREATFEEIDDIMLYLNEKDPSQGVNKALDSAPWHQPGPAPTQMSLTAAASEAPLNLPPPTPSLPYQQLAPEQPIEQGMPTEIVDAFVDPSQNTVRSLDPLAAPFHSHHSGGSMPPSEWESDFNGEEQLKLESRVNFFDGHVNDIVGGILAARLGPLEASLDRIQHAISSMSRGTPPSRRERRSISGEVQDSDADDEDDVPPVPRRSMSPRRDRRMEQMRAVVLEALNAHQFSASSLQPARSSSPTSAVGDIVSTDSVATILKSLESMKEQFGQSLRLAFRGEDLRNIVEDAVERRMPQTPQSAEPTGVSNEDENQKKSDALQARITELEESLRLERQKTEQEVVTRRAAEDKAADLCRALETAETKIEVEVMNRSLYDQRVTDLEDKLKQEAEHTQAELATRKTAEDRIAEIQRLLRISSDEEMRLREAVDDRDAKLKELGEVRDNHLLRLTTLEASHTTSEKTHSDLQNRLNNAESELRELEQEARHWRAEAERAINLSQDQGNDLVQTATELRHLKKVVDTLGTQLEENERIRDSWRSKFVALQEDMARAAREVAEESARHIKREQSLIARHEVLDAKLQAEARTRERLESELERLENGERQAMRAVSELKRYEALIGELRTENHNLHKNSLRYQSEFEEARESAAREVQRTRDSMQGEVDSANHQVNVVRVDLEDQMAQLRGQLEQVKLDADTSKARLEMLLEEAETTKKTALEAAEADKRHELEEAKRAHRSEVEDLEARYERQINNAAEDAQRAEQNLLERLSISTSKTEHLQDRVAHLEEKLEIAREAAQAAAKAAKASGPGADLTEARSVASSTPAIPLQPAANVHSVSHGIGLPEKISPQALRESIMVLQDQLQQREHRIEELEHTLDKVDPEADIKIAKRDDEITWLRELLAVRHSDLKDIITALGREEHDPDRVRDAVIRLQANLQMEEQERERAMNGGSAINLPNIAASIRDAATPRVAQAVGPLAAAWGSWRKARDSNAGSTFSSLSGALLSSPAPASVSRRSGPPVSSTVTPSRAASSSISSRASRTSRAVPAEPQSGSDSSFLSGLMTPPTSGVRQTPQQQQQQQQQQQPTAFSSTGRRYTGGQPGSRHASRSDNKLATRDVTSTPLPTNFRRASRSQPVTPPMMRTSAYDSDAQAEEFDDAAFFDD